MGKYENHEKPTVSASAAIFLDDLPTDDDAIGPHQGIAHAISEIIRDGTIEGGKTIGLTGTWGSGKSTVMELVRRELVAEETGNGPQAKVFVFDSWAHQGDPLRLSFLEELGNFLTKEKWGQDKDWLKSLNELWTVTHTTETVKTSGLSWAGKAFAVTLPIALAANTLLDHYAWDVAFPTKEAAEGLFSRVAQPVIGYLLLALALSPLLVVIAACVWRALRGNKKDEPSNDRETPLSLFLQRTPEKETTKSEREANPTSIEFRKCFLKMLEAALRPEERRLVIALDNLDRIEQEEALSIISTMRVFMDPQAVQNRSYLKRLWIVLPVDLKALEQLWPSTNGNQTPSNRTQGHEASAFIDKIFQIRFHVPEPVLPAWHPYLRTLIGRAFPDLSQTSSDCFSIVHSLFHRKGIPDHRPLSPRDVKTFVNRLVAVYRLRPEIPLSVLALSVLYSREVDGLRTNFSQLDFIPSTVSDLVQSDVQDHGLGVYLASIHFNVSLEQAFHTTVTPRITAALDNGDAADLAKGANEVQGFPELLEQVVADYCVSRIPQEPLVLLQAATALSELDIDKVSTAAGCWRHLYSGLGKVTGLQGITLSHLNGVFALLKYSIREGSDEHRNFLGKLLTLLSVSLSEGSSVSDVSSWVKAVMQILPRINQSNKDLVVEHFRVPGDAGVYAKVVLQLSRLDIDDERIELFKPCAKESSFYKEVLDELITNYTQGHCLLSLTDPFYMLYRSSKDWPWSMVTAMLRNSMRPETLDQSAGTGLGMLQMLNALVLYDLDGGAKDRFSEMVRDNSMKFLWHCYQLRPQETNAYYAVTTLLCLPVVSKRQPNVLTNITELNAEYKKVTTGPSTYPEITQAVARIVHAYRLRERFERLSSETPKLAGFVSAVLPQIDTLVQEEDDRCKREYEKAIAPSS